MAAPDVLSSGLSVPSNNIPHFLGSVYMTHFTIGHVLLRYSGFTLSCFSARIERYKASVSHSMVICYALFSVRYLSLCSPKSHCDMLHEKIVRYTLFFDWYCTRKNDEHYVQSRLSSCHVLYQRFDIFSAASDAIATSLARSTDL